jgi:hypothetical protein
MEPPPRSRMYGSTAWLSHSAVPRLTSIRTLRSCGVASTAAPRLKVPMVFTSTSGEPISAAIRSIRALAAAGSVASPATRWTPSGSSPSACSPRSTPTTAYPAAARVRAVARPSCPPAPTTTATRRLGAPPPADGPAFAGSMTTSFSCFPARLPDRDECFPGAVQVHRQAGDGSSLESGDDLSPARQGTWAQVSGSSGRRVGVRST